MKRKLLPLILVASLQGAPAPALATDMPMAEMARMMLVMMDMFAWMMGGGRSHNYFPYGGYGGYPGGIPGGMGGWNPYSMSTLGTLYGGGYPYANPAMWNSPGLGGFGNFPFNSFYPGVQPYGYNQGRYGSIYSPGPYRQYNWPYYARPAYPRYTVPRKPRKKINEKKEHSSKVVVQPVIIQPTLQDNQSASASSKDWNGLAKGGQGSDKIVSAPPPVVIDVPTDADIGDPYRSGDGSSYGGYREDTDQYDDRARNPYSRNGIQPWQRLFGEWLGINGEYIYFNSDTFQMVDSEKMTEGEYQLRNGIMKAQLVGSDTPTYFQYRIEGDYLMFLSENGQRMLFRRMYR